MKKIALIYSNYYRPVKMYYTRWPEQFKNAFFDTKPYTLNSANHRIGVEDTTFYSEGLITNILRFLKFYFPNPSLMTSWFKAQEHVSLLNRIRIMIDFGDLINYQPDILQLVNSSTYIKIRELYLPDAPKLISSFRGYDIVSRPFEDPVWNNCLPELFKRAEGLHFVSEWLRDKALALGAPESKTRVIYAGVDSEFYKPSAQKRDHNLKKKKIKITSTGRLVGLKGYDYAIQSIKQLIEKGFDIEYSIIGDGRDRVRLSRLVDELQITKNVVFLGKKTREEIKSNLENSDIYLHPSLTEALAGAILEACSMGLPVIATSVGGTPEIINDGINGLLVKSKDPDAITAAVLQLINHPEHADKMREEARKTAITKFSIQNETSNWNEFHQQILG